jgi:hypothetical protein
MLADTFVDDKLLDENDLSLLRAYTLKVEDGLMDKTFNKLCFVFPQASIDMLKNTEKHIQSLSGFQPVRYDCCHPHPSAPLAHMKPCRNAQSATPIDVKLMGQHLRHIYSTCQLFRISMQWSQIPPMHERCNTELVTNMTQQK